jgi:hypothetical protein
MDLTAFVASIEEHGWATTRPLLADAHRRVIHIEYAAHGLRSPLEWYDRVA